MFKIAFLFLCWLLVVGTSVYFTTTGLDIAYPGKAVFYGFSDVELLGFALCVGQYASIHAGILLLGKKGARQKTIAGLSLILAIILSFSNILFAYVSISHKASSSELVEVASNSKLESLQARMADLKETRKSLQASVEAIPSTHSTNRLKQQQAIQPELTRINQELSDLSAQVIAEQSSSVAIRQEASGASSVNEAFGWLPGLTPNKVIAGILAFSLEPLAVILMMLITSYSDSIGVERREMKRKLVNATLKLPTRMPAPINSDAISDKTVEVVYGEEHPIQVQQLPLRRPR